MLRRTQRAKARNPYGARLRAGAGERVGERRGLGHAGILVKALGIALLLTGLKWVANLAGLEFIETLPLLTALMGGVVFTLAILVAGVLADFKESERIVGELASQLRRLHTDIAIIARGEALQRMQGQVLALTKAVNASLREGKAVHLKHIYAPIAELDRGLAAAVAGGAPSSPARTVQVSLGNVVRIVDRLEVIVETTFVRAAYYFAIVVVTVAVAALTFTQLRPTNQGLVLYGFAVFLVSGLFILIADLDNPFDGAVRVSVRQMEKLEAQLAAPQELAEAAPRAAA